MAKKELTSTFGAHGNRLPALVVAAVVWTILVTGGAWWLLQNRLNTHRINTIATADLRLNGVKEVLAISLRQLGALPLYLSQQRLVSESWPHSKPLTRSPATPPCPATPATQKLAPPSCLKY